MKKILLSALIVFRIFFYDTAQAEFRKGVTASGNSNSVVKSGITTFTYQCSVYDHWTSCPESPEDDYTVELTVKINGNTATVSYENTVFEGTISGNQFEYTYTAQEDGGSTEGTIEATFSSDYSSASGVDSWSWSNGTATCQGGTKFKLSTIEAENDGLVAYYPFDGNANDESGNGYDAIVHGATLTEDRFGNSQSAYLFNGDTSKNYIVSSPVLPTGSSSRTVSVWFATTDAVSTASGWNHNTLVSWGNPTSNHMNDLSVANGKLKFDTYCDGFGGTDSVSNGNWHHYVYTYDESTGISTIYLDGAEQSNKAQDPDTKDSQLFIGKRVGEEKQYMNGKIDDVRIYDRVLSESEIQELYGDGDDPNSIFITGGQLAGQALSDTTWTINVGPGEVISGNVLLESYNTGCSSCIAPMGYTWTWGNRKTDYVTTDTSIPQEYYPHDISVNLAAPETIGTYYIYFVFAWQYNMAYVLSATSSGMGYQVWDDGNDCFDMDSQDAEAAQTQGYLPWVWLTTDGWQNGNIQCAPIKVVVTGDSAETIDVSEYANLSVGHEWVYQQSLYSGSWSVKVDSVTEGNGYEVFLMQEYDSQGFENDQEFISTDLSSGIYQIGSLNDYGQPTEEISYAEPPIPRLLSTFIPGQIYHYDNYTFWDSSWDINLTIVKEAVTVPAGTFSDTWKVTQAFTDGENIYNFSYWYSKGIGLVKREEDGNIWALENYSGFTPGSSSVSNLRASILLLLGEETATPTVDDVSPDKYEEGASDDNKENSWNIGSHEEQNRTLSPEGDTDSVQFIPPDPDCEYAFNVYDNSIDVELTYYIKQGDLFEVKYETWEIYAGNTITNGLKLLTPNAATRYYRFEIKAMASDSIGQYKLKIVETCNDTPIDTEYSYTYDTYEADNYIEASQEIALDQAQQHTISPQGDYDWFKFVPDNPDGKYVFTITDNTIDLYLEASAKIGWLTGEVGTKTITKNSSNNTFTLTPDGNSDVTFYISIRGLQTSSTGDYKIKIEKKELNSNN